MGWIVFADTAHCARAPVRHNVGIINITTTIIRLRSEPMDAIDCIGVPCVTTGTTEKTTCVCPNSFQATTWNPLASSFAS